jgi:hypothetical protein
VEVYIPKVIGAETREDYYRLLMELVANLNDGHTMVMPPGAWSADSEDDWPPIEMRVIDRQCIVSRVKNTGEIEEQNIYPGLRILEINGMPIADHFEREVLRYENYGTRHASEALLLFRVLCGPAGSEVQLETVLNSWVKA